jgi:hypothetical protein
MQVSLRVGTSDGALRRQTRLGRKVGAAGARRHREASVGFVDAAAMLQCRNGTRDPAGRATGRRSRERGARSVNRPRRVVGRAEAGSFVQDSRFDQPLNDSR